MAEQNIIWVTIKRGQEEPLQTAYTIIDNAKNYVERKNPGGRWEKSDAHGLMHIYGRINSPQSKWEYAIFPLELNGFLKSEILPPREQRYEKVDRYNQGKIEVIEVIEDWKLNFRLGSALKYIGRDSQVMVNPSEAEVWFKKRVDDLKKAVAYIQREINVLQGRHEWGDGKFDRQGAWPAFISNDDDYAALAVLVDDYARRTNAKGRLPKFTPKGVPSDG